MPIEKVLVEFAKVSLQLIVANERIAELEKELQAQLATKDNSNACK